MQHTTVVAPMSEDALQAILDGVTPKPPTTASLEDAVFNGLNYPLLAREIARELHKPKVLMARFALTEAQFRLLLTHRPFLRMVKIEQAVWEDSGNAGERARTYHREAQAACASDLALMITDPNLNPTVRLEAAKLSARIAGIYDREPVAAGGPAASHFAVNIHLGDGRVDRIEMAQPAPVIEAEVF